MIAMIMPMSTNTTTATCIQIHVGDIDLRVSPAHVSTPRSRPTGAECRGAG